MILIFSLRALWLLGQMSSLFFMVRLSAYDFVGQFLFIYWIDNMGMEEARANRERLYSSLKAILSLISEFSEWLKTPRGIQG
jgi:hypothetical protein